MLLATFTAGISGCGDDEKQDTSSAGTTAKTSAKTSTTATTRRLALRSYSCCHRRHTEIIPDAGGLSASLLPFEVIPWAISGRLFGGTYWNCSGCNPSEPFEVIP